MRILLITAYFPPDTGSAAHLFYELGSVLVKRGHEVTVLTGMPSYHAQGSLDRYQGRKRLQEEIEGMKVVRVNTLQLPRHLMVGRALWQFGVALSFLKAGLGLPRHDVSLVYSPPVPLGLAAWGIRKGKGTPFILNVQDLFPQSIIDLGLLRNSTIIRGFESMERLVYRKADYITVHSEGNRRHVRGKGAREDKVAVFSNWVDTEFIRPKERLDGFRRKHGFGEGFLASFAGVLGYSQDVDVILEAAHLIRRQLPAPGADPLHWLIVGDGVEKSRLAAKAASMGLDNVRFLPMQARDQYPAVLQASDICLTTLRAKVKTPVVPSKILSIMAAARPVVAGLNLEGDAPRLITESRCGLCVPPEDPAALAKAVLTFYQNPSLKEEMGQNGRRYAEKYLSLDRSGERYESLFQKLTSQKCGN